MVKNMLGISERATIADKMLTDEVVKPLPFSVLKREALGNVRKNDSFVLPAGTQACLLVESIIPSGAEVTFLGLIHLEKETEVAFIAHDEEAGSMRMTLDSSKRREAIYATGLAAPEIDVMAANDMGRMREERALAREFVQDFDGYVADLQTVRRVEFMMVVR